MKDIKLTSTIIIAIQEAKQYMRELYKEKQKKRKTR